MTFKEKLMMDHPNLVSEEFLGGCWGCPYKYGYEKFKMCKVKRQPADSEYNENDCRKCWNREILN